MRAKMEKGPSDAIAGSRPRVATATVLKTTPEQTFEFVSYHRHLGVDEIILFFDDPTDVAADALEGVEGVTVFRCDAAHWSEVGPKGERPARVPPRQTANADWLLRTRSEDLDWIIFIDSDELVYAPDGLHESIARESAGLTVLQLRVLEAIPSHPNISRPFQDVSLFRVHNRKKYRKAKRLRLNTGFSKVEPRRFFRGHVSGKAIVKPNGVVRRMGIHRPREVDEERFRREPSGSMWVLHFDAASFDDWKRKWRGRSEFVGHGYSDRQYQWDEFVRLDEQQDDDGLLELYKKLYMLPKREIPFLRMLGMVRKIKLDPAWFGWSPT